ncbi:Hypothetical_protein [Hexamita inflata]|uniref:Hypothetical_protein n=1 Tax=Hexamita inflata TaxID=28002 RepID=A0ABP1HE14_9EUKA
MFIMNAQVRIFVYNVLIYTHIRTSQVYKIRALIQLHDLDTQMKSKIMIFSFYIGIHGHNICYIVITNEKIAPEPVRSIPPPHMNREFQFNSEMRQRHTNLYGRQSN